MPVYRLDERLRLPASGGGRGRPARGRRRPAARSGWCSPTRRASSPGTSEGQPILWHSPDPRMVLLALGAPRPAQPGEDVMRRGALPLTLDTAFADVIEACAAAPPPGPAQHLDHAGDDASAYAELHRRGLAHSVEAWLDGDGWSAGSTASRSAARSSASRCSRTRPTRRRSRSSTLGRAARALGHRSDRLPGHTEHLARFGATEWPRRRYLRALAKAVGGAHAPRPLAVRRGPDAAALRRTAGSSQLPGPVRPEQLAGPEAGLVLHRARARDEVTEVDVLRVPRRAPPRSATGR